MGLSPPEGISSNSLPLRDDFVFEPPSAVGPVAAKIAFARAFAFGVTAAWWRTLTSRTPVLRCLRTFITDLDLPKLDLSNTQLAEVKGQALAFLSAQDAVHQIGRVYTRMLPREHRAAHGIYYTPPPLVTRLIDQAAFAGVDWTRARILDPACGGGAFLAPVARRIVQEMGNCSARLLMQNVGTRLRGYESDPFGAWLSQVALDAVMLPIAEQARMQVPAVVTVCDSLRTDSCKNDFDLVIGNPPYGRTRLSAADRAFYQRSLYGHANLYGLFTDLALRHTKSGSVIAYVTPTSFLAGEYFKNLRALLGREAPPCTIDFVAIRKGVFEEVLQETVLATYRRGNSPGPITVHEITPTADRIDLDKSGVAVLPDDCSKPWLMPRQPAYAGLVKRLLRMPHRLADWGYTVSTGPLVWNRHKDQLATRPGAKRFPLIWAEAITSDGRFAWRADKRNHAPYFEARTGDDWLLTNTLCVLVQRTTAKEQTRRLIAAALPAQFVFRHGAVVIENHLNMIRPLSKEPRVTADALAAFLNSASADEAFRCVSGSVAVSAYELEALPLPAPEALESIESLIRAGASRERVQSACTQLYHGGS